MELSYRPLHVCSAANVGRQDYVLSFKLYFLPPTCPRNCFAYGKAGRSAKIVIGVKQCLYSPHS